jgi:hypothetical protein
MVTRNGGVSLRAHWVLLFAIAGLLAAGSVACPVWISAMNASSYPCSDEAPMQEECPPSICAVGHRIWLRISAGPMRPVSGNRTPKFLTWPQP